MKTEESKALYIASPPGIQAQILARYANLLTIEARGTYEVGTDAVRDSIALRNINESMHKITSQICMLLDESKDRFSDDTILRIICSPHTESFLTEAIMQVASNKTRAEQGADGKPPDADQSPHKINPNTRLP